MGSERCVAVDGVQVRFGGIAALTDVSLSVDHGEILGLIGPNGAGKTTLFDVISGLRRPAAGTIEYLGEDITARPATWRARHGIRRTFQRQQIFGRLSVAENVVVALEWRGGGGGWLADLVASPSRASRHLERLGRVDEVLELCGIRAMRDELAGRLTIGQARLVEIARALVDQPRLLLLDEPTSGLGDADVDLVGALIRNVRDSEDCAILLVEHDVGFVMRACDRVVVLQLGEVIANGTPEEVSSSAIVAEAYLG